MIAAQAGKTSRDRQVVQTRSVSEGCLRSATPFTALLAAGLFGVHPALAEAVTWTAARNEVIWGGLALPALWLWVRWRQG